MMEYVGPEHLGNREDPLGVANLAEDLVGQVRTEDYCPLGAAGGAEVPCLARKGKGDRVRPS